MSSVTAQILKDFVAYWKYVSCSSLQWKQFCWLVFYSLYKRIVPMCWNLFYNLWDRPWLNTFRTTAFIQFWSATSGGALFKKCLFLVYLLWQGDSGNGEVILCARKRKVPEINIILMLRALHIFFSLSLFFLLSNVLVLVTSLHQAVFLQIWGESWCVFDDYFHDVTWRSLVSS